MVDMSNRKAICARFHELGALRETKLAKSAPLRKQRDAIVNEARATEEALNRKIEEAEAGLYEIDVERGALSRAVGGRTGEVT